MSKTFIGGSVCRRVRIGSRRHVRPNRPCRIHVQQRTVQFSDVPWMWWC